MPGRAVRYPHTPPAAWLQGCSRERPACASAWRAGLPQEANPALCAGGRGQRGGADQRRRRARQPAVPGRGAARPGGGPRQAPPRLDQWPRRARPTLPCAPLRSQPHRLLGGVFAGLARGRPDKRAAGLWPAILGGACAGRRLLCCTLLSSAEDSFTRLKAGARRRSRRAASPSCRASRRRRRTLPRSGARTGGRSRSSWTPGAPAALPRPCRGRGGRPRA